MKMVGAKQVDKVRMCHSNLRSVAKLTSSGNVQFASADGLNQPQPERMEDCKLFDPHSLNFLHT